MTSPGRLEVVSRRPLIVLDGAHNPAAAEALAGALPDTFTGDRLHLVMGVFADKDLEDRSSAGATRGCRVRVGRRQRPSPPAGSGRGRHGRRGYPDRGVRDGSGGARRRADAASADDLILVTGSLYTVAEARRVLLGAYEFLKAKGSLRMAVESTLLIVKPDGVRRGLVGEIVRRAEDKGLRVAQIRSLTIDRPLAEEHYGEHRERPFFGELVGFIHVGTRGRGASGG